jgi:hypothetical protein
VAIDAGAAQSRLVNLSTRVLVGTGSSEAIPGFVLQGGTGSHRMLVRAVGPGLAAFGVEGCLSRPSFMLLSREGADHGGNSGWDSGDPALQELMDTTGAFPLDADNPDAALAADLPAGSFTAVVSGVSEETGITLVEVYDGEPDAASKLVNLSTRGWIGSGDAVMIAGLVIDGDAAMTVLVRAVGATLGRFGIVETGDPELRIVDRDGRTVGYNATWDNADPLLAEATTATGAFSLWDPSFGDAATVLSLPPGAYTVVVRANRSTHGIGLVEVYVVP